MQTLFNNEVDAETKLMQENCIILFESGIEENQRLAFKMAEMIGLSKGEMLWNYILKRWNKNDIIEHWSKAYLDDKQFFILFQFSFFGVSYSITDFLESDIEIYCADGKDTLDYRLATWQDNSDINKMYQTVLKQFKKIVFKEFANKQ